MDYLLPLSIFSGIAVTTCGFIATYILFVSKGNKLLRLLFVGLILSVAIRIGKSIMYYHFDIPLFAVALGYLGSTCTGVFLWLYIKCSRNHDAGIKVMDLFFFVPALIGFFFIWPFEILSAKTIYKLGTSWSFICTSFGFYYIFKDWAKRPLLVRNWNMMTAISITIILVFFWLQLYSETLFEYALGAGMASMIMYGLFFFLLKKNKLHVVPKEISSIDQELLNKIQKALEVEKLYRKNALTVNEFASLLDQPTYKVSLAIREKYNKPFPELINHFRVKDVTEVLSNPNSSLFKVEALAYDAGFSTPSAFYAAFKKETGKTPRAYQREIMKKRQRQKDVSYNGDYSF
ncbi:AraC family transcriptional regulator [Muricauda sp. SCSIO 64092]|uniref:helix-turn-helix domain-containing protein n=1 Tax=Allomuricauda sp. SCSIO 64092 TaxID=2908842 RepID=UPI001FF2CC67|nr:AraC family transcriptional regulator [Muricauda sp. SCSIO 64092]UOY05369.1 AraC family transcriptional regulator [Muricauda sp. SCSIO 64092]